MSDTFECTPEKAIITIEMTDAGLHMHFEGPEGADVTRIAEYVLGLVRGDMERTGLHPQVEQSIERRG